ncbi:hypothetical protein [Maridesulfovibrio zosterae]|uniref:hypothetical protein n=1 Tax=Maridesulfovibrio zosterae TaxID=82171 RepID=UPI0012EC2DDD|nr:hypothetical protein [Maridesulfovibrio zosterae]
MTKYKIEIDPDLLDLAPVLMDSLNNELEDMLGSILKSDFELVIEKAHSSRGAALTFGFELYAYKMLQIKKEALNEDKEALLKICKGLEVMLDCVEFTVAK